jgi:radical SAM superfamily enzyme YgiQ (UPF0313 family)
MTTRGCPCNCSYCCNDSIQQLYSAIGKGHHIRRRSVANVMAELEHARDHIDGLKEDAWLEEFTRPRARPGSSATTTSSSTTPT